MTQQKGPVGARAASEKLSKYSIASRDTKANRKTLEAQARNHWRWLIRKIIPDGQWVGESFRAHGNGNNSLSIVMKDDLLFCDHADGRAKGKGFVGLIALQQNVCREEAEMILEEMLQGAPPEAFEPNQKKRPDKSRSAEQAEAAGEARRIYTRSQPCETHPYLTRKAISSTTGIRTYAGCLQGLVGPLLVIPFYTAAGELSTLQFICADGQKRFLTGGRKCGCFFKIGFENATDAHPIVIAEGTATALSAHEAVGWPVVSAGDCGNLLSVAEIIRKQFPERAIILGADNDAATSGNPGISKAIEAAKSIGARVCAPPAVDGRGCDWNDYATSSGLDVVREAFEAAMLEEPYEKPPADPRPVILYNALQLPRMVDEALATLRGHIYQRSDGGLWRLGDDAMLHLVGHEWLNIKLAEVSRWAVLDEKTGTIREIVAPHRVAKAIIALRGNYGDAVETLRGIVHAPFMRADGTIVEQPGYDPMTELFTACDESFFEDLPESPTLEDARAAIKTIDELIGEFPFVDAAAKAVFISAALTAIQRPLLPSAPIFVINAPVAGSGKSMLCELAAILATGKVPTTLSFSTVEELEKALGAALLQGETLISIDNLNAEIMSDRLCQMATGAELGVRVLGRSEVRKMSVGVTIMANGNNIAVTGDLVRRSLGCGIDPQMAKPDSRVFSFNPVSRAKEDRPRYVRAAITILKAYHDAGCPDGGLQPFGSFEEWSKTVRQAVVWCGLPDPLSTRARIEASDPQIEGYEAILSEWHKKFGDKPTSTQAALSVSDIREAFAEMVGNTLGFVSTRRAGNLLRCISGRRFSCGFHIERDEKRGKKGTRWTVLEGVSDIGKGVSETQKVYLKQRKNAETVKIPKY